MASELITSWAAHDSALTGILLLATKSVRIFDDDLARLKLEDARNAEILQRFLASKTLHTAQFAVRNVQPVQRTCPRLMRLLATYPEKLSILACPEHLTRLNDSMVIADGRHALIRLHKDNVRSRIITDSPEECAPYASRFEDILREGGDHIGATTLGL